MVSIGEVTSHAPTCNESEGGMVMLPTPIAFWKNKQCLVLLYAKYAEYAEYAEYVGYAEYAMQNMQNMQNIQNLQNM